MPLVLISGAPVLFAHVPKCAGTSVEYYLQAHFGPLALIDRTFSSLLPARRWSRTSPQHADAETLGRMFPPGFLKASFAMVRHPVARLISVFRFQRDIERQIPPDLTLSDWLTTLRRPAARRWVHDNHVRAMDEMVPPEATVFRLEDGWHPVIDWLQALAADSVVLPREMVVRNVTDRRLAFEKRDVPPVHCDPTALALIQEIYAGDFLRFGYDPEWNAP
jgi:hypothetical protein